MSPSCAAISSASPSSSARRRPRSNRIITRRKGKYRLVELLQRVEEGQMPVTHVLDIRSAKKGERRLSSPRADRGHPGAPRSPRAGHHLPQPPRLFLLAAMSAMRPCRNVPNCSVALTFHRRAEKLRCHLCDFSSGVPHACPQCGFAPFKYAGSGTEKVEHALVDAFPKPRSSGWIPTHARKDAYAKTLGDFASGKIDILVGTQMIAKGLHFPERHLRRRHQCRPRVANPDFRRERMRLPAARCRSPVAVGAGR